MKMRTHVGRSVDRRATDTDLILVGGEISEIEIEEEWYFGRWRGCENEDPRGTVMDGLNKDIIQTKRSPPFDLSWWVELPLRKLSLSAFRFPTPHPLS